MAKINFAEKSISRHVKFPIWNYLEQRWGTKKSRVWSGWTAAAPLTIEAKMLPATAGSKMWLSAYRFNFSRIKLKLFIDNLDTIFWNVSVMAASAANSSSFKLSSMMSASCLTFSRDEFSSIVRQWSVNVTTKSKMQKLDVNKIQEFFSWISDNFSEFLTFKKRSLTK